MPSPIKHSPLLPRWLTLAARAAAVWPLAAAAWAQDGGPQAQAGGGGVRIGLLWACAVLFAAVFAAMLLAVWRHRSKVRKRGGSMPEPAWVELCWTLIPILIVLGAAWPVFRLLGTGAG